MSGFDNAGVDREFFGDTQVKSNFLCNLGYGDHSMLFARSPRFDFFLCLHGALTVLTWHVVVALLRNRHGRFRDCDLLNVPIVI
jgi:hypothetical protein